MKRTLVLGLLVLLGVSAVSLAGDIQVLCPPGLRVYLDDELMGTSTLMEDGLFLMKVPLGSHTIRVEKRGFLPQSFQVEVTELPIEIRVGEFFPEPETRREREAKAVEVAKPTGTVVVTSAPQNCMVEIDGKLERKATPQLVVSTLTIGEHTVSFSKDGFETVSGTFQIPPTGEVTVRGDLIEGKVEVLHEGKGSLRLTSTPMRCTVRLLGMGREKIHSTLNLSHLPAGEHRLVVNYKNLERSTTILILDGKRTFVDVSFMTSDKPFTIRYEPE